jgi:hypothetical protein
MQHPEEDYLESGELMRRERPGTLVIMHDS